MATPDRLPLDELIAPIPGDDPCGESLKFTPVWDEISAARRGRVDAITEGADQEPEWSRVESLACDVLATQSKDLQIAGWLTEALVHTAGFAGLRDGLRLISLLVERYWDGLHPKHDEEDPEVRAAPFIWLTDADGGARLPGLLRQVPLTDPAAGEVFSLESKDSFQVRPPREGESDSDYNARAKEAQRQSEMFQAAVTASPSSFYADLRDDLATCLELISATERLVDEKLGVEYAPSWSAIRGVLEDCKSTVDQVCATRGIGIETNDGTAGSDEAGGGQASSNGHPASSISGPIRTRGDAVMRLREVVEFFKQTEPHSPVAHLVQRSVRWAEMPLESILTELIQDKSTLTRIWDTLGVQPGFAADDDDDD